MRKATKSDSGIWLLRMVFPNHLPDSEPNFPPLNKICQPAGTGETRGISVYNMSLCDDNPDEAFRHAEQAREQKPIYAVGITVGQCLELGAEVWLNHGIGTETHQYHAFIKTKGDKATRGDQREDIMTKFEANGKFERTSRLPEI